MKKIRTFYHYTRFIPEIKKDKLLLATSFAKTYQFDWVLDVCPEELLSKKEIKKLEAYKHQNADIIKLYKKEQDDEENYESIYRDLKLKFKNKLLDEFFNDEGYVLAFTKKFQEGWLGTGMGAGIFQKIGNKYVKFRINEKIAEKSYVLEQKFWAEDYHGKIFEKKFGKSWEKMAEAFSEDMFQGKKPKFKRYNEFKKMFVKTLFAKYYKSIVRLDHYKNNFKVAEFWIGEDIPISRCEFGEISFKELKEKTGISKKDVFERKMTRADISERKKKKSRSSIAKK